MRDKRKKNTKYRWISVRERKIEEAIFLIIQKYILNNNLYFSK